MKKPTLFDVAERAGVSYATVDRVINGRCSVSRKAADKVNQAVTELGYVRNAAAANLSQGKAYKFAFVIPGGSGGFFRALTAIAEDSREKLRADHIDIDIYQVPLFSPTALVDQLDAFDIDAYNGLAVVGTNDASVWQALARFRNAGHQVVALVADLDESARDHYVGIDNIMAGRTAGRMAGLAHGGKPGMVLPIIGTKDARDHSDRLAGFQQTMAAHFPNLAILPEMVSGDDHQVITEQTRQALTAHPDITAIYNAGAGNAGLLPVFEKAPDRAVIVTHELGASTIQGLDDGIFDIVIDQRPHEEIRLAVEIMRNGVDQRAQQPVQPLTPEIYVKENVSPALRQARWGDSNDT